MLTFSDSKFLPLSLPTRNWVSENSLLVLRCSDNAIYPSTWRNGRNHSSPLVLMGSTPRAKNPIIKNKTKIAEKSPQYWQVCQSQLCKLLMESDLYIPQGIFQWDAVVWLNKEKKMVVGRGWGVVSKGPVWGKKYEQKCGVSTMNKSP